MPDLDLNNLDQIIVAMHKMAEVISDHIEVIEKEGDIAPVLKAYHSLKGKHAALEEARKAVGKRLLYLEKSLIPRMLEASGMDKVRVPELKRSFYKVDKYSTKVHDKDGLWEWLRENQAGDLITETVNAGTLTSFLKEKLLEEGIEIPSELAELTSYETTGSSAYTPAKSATKKREKAAGQ